MAFRIDRGPTRSVDVVVSVDAEHTVEELTAAVAAFVGVAGPVRLVRRDGERDVGLDAAATVVAAGLVSGATVRLVPDDGPPERDRRPPVDDAVASGPCIDVVGGPDTGRSVRLPGPGRHLLGRDAAAAVHFDDPSVSRRHAVLIVDDEGRVTIQPVRGATNGLEVAGVEVDGPTSIAETDVIRLGGTRIVVRDVPIAEQSGRVGTRHPGSEVRPGPYRPPIVERSELEEFGPIPERPEPRRPPVISILAPLGLGLVMFAVFGHVQFLLLVLVSPVLLLASVVEDRRSARREMRRRVDEFDAALSRYCERLGELCELERRVRHAAAPDLADLIRRAHSRAPTLWQRRSTNSDALVVRIGVGRARAVHRPDIVRGGADGLRSRAADALTRFETIAEVPVTVDLRRQVVVAVCGPAPVVNGLAASMLVQVATLLSPDEFMIAAVIGPDRPFDWLDWLPHVRTTGVSSRCIVRSADEAARVFDQVLRADGGAVDRTRRSVVMVDGTLDLDAAAEFLDAVTGTDVVVVWLADDGCDIPRQARTVVTTGSTGSGSWAEVWSLECGRCEERFEPEILRPDVADAAAMALAPLRDASGVGSGATIPGTVSLFDVLDLPIAPVEQLREAVVQRWSVIGRRRTGGLEVTVGHSGHGRVVLDLVADGPHALVAGTSGSGKSEFLQAMVSSLVTRYPPDRVNILFVDYKGGATSQVLGSLPHSVGTVSNLSPGMARRVLVSLRAELERRMALLHGRAADLGQLLLLDPGSAPPSLVVVVDEFATLVAEVPEFVNGMIDIAQRGRSLGIHLVLATQRPSGSITEDILANTGLRVGLRMVDPVESTTILGTPAAAGLRGHGRAIARCGAGRPVEFQVAHANAPLAGEARGVVVRELHSGRSGVHAAHPSKPVTVDDTQLRCVVDAVAEAAVRIGARQPFRPWCDPLPESVEYGSGLDVSSVPVDERAGWPVVIGLLDEPTLQRQRPAIVDLAGGVLAVGAKGAGVSTLVRTLVAAARNSTGCGDVVVFDGRSSGLAEFAASVGVTAAVPASDLEAMTRWIIALEDQVGRRRRAQDSGDRSSSRRILLVLHGFEGLMGTLVDGGGGRRAGSTPVGGEPWVERLLRLVVDGTDVGIASVVTVGRRGEVPSRVESSLGTRIVLRTSEPGAWVDHGIVARDVQDLVPGRGHLVRVDGGPTLVQVARCGSNGALVAPPSDRSDSLRSRRLPDRAPISAWARPPAPASAPGVVEIGVADVTGDAVVVDLERSDFVVFGPPGSGRSTALAVVAATLAAQSVATGAPPVVVLGPCDGPFAVLRGRAGIMVIDDAIDDRVDAVRSGGAFGSGPSGVVVIDDADHLDADGRVTVALAGAHGVRLMVAVEQRSMGGYSSNALVVRARRSRRMLALTPDDPTEFLQATGVRWPVRPGLSLPPGRGVLVVDRVPTVLQVSSVLDPGPSVQSTR